MKLTPVLLTLAALTLTACGPVPPNSAYLNRGGPESLIDVSSEVVNLGTATSQELHELSQWVARDVPTAASLNCYESDRNCAEARKILELNGVPVTPGVAGQDTVTLVYERILARDCSSAYVDNRGNYYNTNHPSFGCATAANIVQHVTDKQDLIEPGLSGDPSATRAVNDMRRAYTPRPVLAPYSVEQSQTGNSRAAR